MNDYFTGGMKTETRKDGGEHNLADEKLPELDFSFLFDDEDNNSNVNNTDCAIEYDDGFLKYLFEDEGVVSESNIIHIDKEPVKQGDDLKSYDELMSMDGKDLALLESRVFKACIGTKPELSSSQKATLKDRRRIYKNRGSAKKSAMNKDTELQQLRKDVSKYKRQLKELTDTHASTVEKQRNLIMHYEESFRKRSAFNMVV